MGILRSSRGKEIAVMYGPAVRMALPQFRDRCVSGEMGKYVDQILSQMKHPEVVIV